MLSGLFRAFGAEAAQRIAVSLAVLIFVWGAFVFISTVAGRRAWNLMPCIAMLRMGGCSTWVSSTSTMALGLCFWAMAAAWNRGPRALAAAAGLLRWPTWRMLCRLVWCLCLLAYVALARRRSPRGAGFLTLGVLALMAVVRVWAMIALSARWSPSQIARVTGADQVWVFDAKVLRCAGRPACFLLGACCS